MIVGTAGHIDHGKTTLVRALTGVDTDRLPEEKARGISIELGFAFLPVPGAPELDPLGFIDVPGHERLVHTMLAGATGIDFALLVVAADDGVMPQTREHLAVLSLLGLRDGLVVITKADRVDASRLAEVRAEVGALLSGTPFAAAAAVTVSAHSGAGIAALRERLFDAARSAEASSRRDDLAFRLAVDRVFTIAGTGTVVTGTVHAGQVRVGEELALVPSANGATSRVRSLHAQNRPVAEAHAGQRCALGLAGMAKSAIARGDWLVDPAVAFSTDRFDGELTLWPLESSALRSGTRVHVHVGAATTLGTVAVLGRTYSDATAESIPPGETALLQIVLAAPIGAWRGDRVVLRDNAATRTLAGGVVLDPCAPARYRRTPQRLAELAAAGLADQAARLAGRLAVATSGVALPAWARAEGLAARAPLPDLPPGSLLARESDGAWALGATACTRLATTTLETLRGLHAQEPEAVGADGSRLRRLVAPRVPAPLWRALLETMRNDGRVEFRDAFVRLPDHGARLSAIDERLAGKIAPIIAMAGFEGCWARDLARATGESEALMRTTLGRLAQRGELHQVVKDLCFSPAAIERLAAQARAIASVHQGNVDAAGFRDATGLGRKRAIQILEYFDHIGLLRRTGDVHRLRTDTQLFGGSAG